jgi:transposase-like protein
MTLGKWVKKAKDGGHVQDKDLSETERAELELLRKDKAVLRIAVLRMERDFAKKWQFCSDWGSSRGRTLARVGRVAGRAVGIGGR